MPKQPRRVCMDLRRCVAVLGMLVTLPSSAVPAALAEPATPAAPAQIIKSFDAAAALGARPGVSDLSLSPDGKSVAYVAPTTGQGSMLLTLDLAKGSKPQVAMAVAGKPERLGNCHWVSNERLVCIVYGVIKSPLDLLPFTRTVAVNRDGGTLKMLSTKDS